MTASKFKLGLAVRTPDLLRLGSLTLALNPPPPALRTSPATLRISAMIQGLDRGDVIIMVCVDKFSYPTISSHVVSYRVFVMK
jgi:hypothetical protein